MAQAFGDDLRVDALFEHQRGVRVPEIVEAHGRDIGELFREELLGLSIRFAFSEPHIFTPHLNVLLFDLIYYDQNRTLLPVQSLTDKMTIIHLIS